MMLRFLGTLINTHDDDDDLFLQGSHSVTDRQTDHATQLVRIGRIYVRSTAMRPNSNTNDNVYGAVIMARPL